MYRSTKTAVAYYKNMLFSEGKESSAFTKERFERLEVHPMPKPIDSEAIHRDSQLPLEALAPEFQVAIKHLAKDTGFWAEDSQLGLTSPTTPATLELDTFQGFTTRVKTAVTKVDASKSQPLVVTQCSRVRRWRRACKSQQSHVLASVESQRKVCGSDQILSCVMSTTSRSCKLAVFQLGTMLVLVAELKCLDVHLHYLLHLGLKLSQNVGEQRERLALAAS